VKARALTHIFGVVGVSAGLVLAALALPSSASAITCDNPNDASVFGVADSSSNYDDIQGGHASLLVNDFVGDDQCGVDRNIVAIKDSNDFVNIGWWAGTKGPFCCDDGHTHVVAYASVEFGTAVVRNTTNYTPAGGTHKDFKIANGDQNYFWAFDYEGNYIDSVPSQFHQARSMQTRSDRAYPRDTLHAHFQGIQICTFNGGSCQGHYHTAHSLTEGHNDTTDWHFCRIDDTEHYVRHNHC
jgi:hypothetical protein